MPLEPQLQKGRIFTNRTIKKQFWLSPHEDAELKKKARQTCLNEATLLRMLIAGLHPKEKPDERFYKAMEPLWSIGNNLNQLTRKAHSLNFIDTPMLEDTVKNLNRFITAVEEEFLAPEKVGGANDRN